MKKSIILILLLLVSCYYFACKLDNNSAVNPTASRMLDCPVPGCESTIVVHLDDGCATGKWCGPFGTSTFQTDEYGNFYASCLCEGTYYFCSDCSDAVYVGYCSGGPTESFATSYDRPCPCD